MRDSVSDAKLQKYLSAFWNSILSNNKSQPPTVEVLKFLTELPQLRNHQSLKDFTLL
jgi:hypothetical protein